MVRAARARGFVVYDGPSLLTGRPIIALLAMQSGNTQTGPMPQLWILCRDAEPGDAIHTDANADVCGSCPAQGEIVDGRRVGRWCYVVLAHGPRMVYRSWQRGNYYAGPDALDIAATRLIGRTVRLGAYGDPAAVPLAVLDRLLRRAAGWRGYTHQWRDGFALQRYCMASVENDAQEAEAHAMGYRTFRITETDAQARDLPGHVLCPKSTGLLTCDVCRLCCGTSKGYRGHVAIPIHGQSKRRALPVLQGAA